MKAKDTVTYTLPMWPIFVVLLVLKLTGIANISWFWVFFPLWCGIAFVVIVLAFLLACLIFAAIVAFIVGMLR